MISCTCKYCNKLYKNTNSLKNHEVRCPSNQNRLKSWAESLNKEQRKALTKNATMVVTKNRKGRTFEEIFGEEKAIAIKQKALENRKSLDSNIELIRRQKLSRIAKDRKLGGYKKGSGRGKSGWYKGIWCDSSWELAFVVYHLDHNIKIKRTKAIRSYTFNNIVKKYHPDFEVNNTIYEIKGYITDESISKQEQNLDIIVINKNEIKIYLDYVISKYGRNFISLYE